MVSGCVFDECMSRVQEEADNRNWRRFSPRLRIVDMLFQIGSENISGNSRMAMLPQPTPLKIPDGNRLRGIGIIPQSLCPDIALFVLKILPNRH